MGDREGSPESVHRHICFSTFCCSPGVFWGFCCLYEGPLTLRGPQEGGSRTDFQEQDTTIQVQVSAEADGMVQVKPSSDSPEEVDTPLLTQSNLGMDMLSEVQGKYDTDPFFWVIYWKSLMTIETLRLKMK